MFYRSWIYVGFVFIAMAFTVSCSRETVPVADPDELVRLGGESITVQDLESEEELLRAEGRTVLSKRELLQRMIEFKAQAHRAREMGLDKEPSVERRIEKVLVAALRERENAHTAEEVSDEDIRAVYEADIEKYTRPAMDRLAVLFLQVNLSASSEKRAEIRKKMEEAREMALKQPPPNLRGGETPGFGKISVTYSDDQVSRYRGGDVGWSSRNMPSARIPEGVWKAGIALDIGAVSEILEMEDGLYLVKKTDFRAESVSPFESVRDSIFRKVLTERRTRAENDFVAACVKLAAPEKNDARIEKLSDDPGVNAKVAGASVPAMGVPNEK